MNKRIGVLGAGSWGATLSSVLAWKKHDVTLWEYDKKQAREVAQWRSLKFFPNLIIPKQVAITSSLADSVSDMDFVIFALPSHTIRAVAAEVNSLKCSSRTVFISAAKGIEYPSLKRISEIIADELPQSAGRMVILSGPTHAEEVSRKISTAAVAASTDTECAKSVQKLFTTSYFRVYTNSDVTGVEAGAALKNIFAIASGICDGLGLGDNTKAALATRGLRELSALGIKMGGKPSTFIGLTGLGDLIVTCFSKHSRNRALGEKLGKGLSLAQSEKDIMMVAEGVKTTESAYSLGQKYHMELPIINKVYEILYKGKKPRKALTELMMRQPKAESAFAQSKSPL